jgi:hypothetical protein
VVVPREKRSRKEESETTRGSLRSEGWRLLRGRHPSYIDQRIVPPKLTRGQATGRGQKAEEVMPFSVRGRDKQIAIPEGIQLEPKEVCRHMPLGDERFEKSRSHEVENRGDVPVRLPKENRRGPREVQNVRANLLDPLRDCPRRVI